MEMNASLGRAYSFRAGRRLTFQRMNPASSPSAHASTSFIDWPALSFASIVGIVPWL